jgi:hypothetical protein
LIEININNGFVDECKIIMFSERGIEVWDGVNEEEKYWVEWEEINSVKKLGEEG